MRGRLDTFGPEQAREHAGLVASANWHACASFIAARCPDALFIDMGSTTTDVVPIIDGKVAARGYTDGERLAAGELVYTGLVRSFIMACAGRAPFNGSWTPLINENFANMADVYRILGSLPADADMMATADGREKTRKGSLARLARMVGVDAADADDRAWTALAQWFAEMQMRGVIDAVMLVNSQHLLAGRRAGGGRRDRCACRQGDRSAHRPRICRLRRASGCGADGTRRRFAMRPGGGPRPAQLVSRAIFTGMARARLE